MNDNLISQKKKKMKMKKILLLLFITAFSSNVIAQGNFAKKASKITNEMTEVLSLSGEEKAKVYQIQLKRFQDVESIREKHKDDAEIRKSELKKVFNKLYGKLSEALGKNKMQQWGDYKRESGRD